jgi:CheY-like chemotaxis protein
MPLPDGSHSPSSFTVFVVEDEALVALNLEDMLADLGCTVLGPAMKIEAAEGMIAAGIDADLDILDVNIGGRPIYPIAEKLIERSMPIVFATGYGRSGLPEEWRDRPVLQKPYAMAELAECIARFSGPASPA